MSEMKQLESTPAALAVPVEEALVPVCRESFGATLRAVVLTGSVARNEASYHLQGWSGDPAQRHRGHCGAA